MKMNREKFEKAIGNAISMSEKRRLTHFYVEGLTKLWLDDCRDPVATTGETDWIWVKTAQEAIMVLKMTNQIRQISLDHDLGDEKVVGTGYEVACWIEEQAFNKGIPPLKWAIHSANPVGRSNMEAALIRADQYWKA